MGKTDNHTFIHGKKAFNMEIIDYRTMKGYLQQ